MGFKQDLFYRYVFSDVVLTGNIIHSVKYKDVISNGMVGHRVLIVGIGNSAVDAATNCASVGRYKI